MTFQTGCGDPQESLDAAGEVYTADQATPW